MAGLFTFDNFAGALVLQSLVAYWFNTKFGLEIGSLAVVFFGTQVMAAISLWASAKIANRIGHINTMVFSQLAASALFVSAAFAPVVWMAIFFLELRAFLNQMDTAPRDAFMMSVVGPEERVAIGSMHIVGRNVMSSFSPSAAAFLWTSISASAPFVASSVLKTIYDVVLWVMFKDVKLLEEDVPAVAARQPSEQASD